ncbi:MAG: SIMPL domain-containing protein [Elusimicrobia bacterium]|nr:SIMPL domain-containing protein [Elusimicrobiota bacterium]
MKKLVTLAVLAAMTSAAWAQNAVPSTPNVVTVTGRGSVSVDPDCATVTYQFIDEVRGTQAAPLAKSAVPQLVQKNNARVNPAVAELKRTVGNDGTVEVNPSIQPIYEYDQKTQRQYKVGYKIVSNVQVKLEGRQPIEQKLNQLFDTSKVGADEVGEPVMSLQTATMQSARRQANQKAVDDAVAEATSQLEKGETLGKTLQRGERVNVPTPRYESARAAMAPPMADAPGGGQAVVETGKVTVSTAIQFVFEVLGTPARMGAQAVQGQPGS